MTPDEARALLGLDATASIDAAVERHRRLQRVHHPDLRGGSDRESTERSARLNEALSVLRREAASTAPSPPRTATRATTDAPRAAARPAHIVDHEELDVTRRGDSLFLTAPPDETFVRLLDVGAGLGGIGHVDRRLGLLEVLVRFEGGPTCSVLLTLQGHAFGTEVCCEMESIEAAPTPPIDPVLVALEHDLRAASAHPPPASPS